MSRVLVVVTSALIVGTFVLGVLLLSDEVVGQGYTRLLTSLAILSVIASAATIRMRRSTSVRSR